MKNRILKGLLLGSVLISMLACNTKKEEETPVVVDKEQVKKEIQAKEDEFAATYNAGEVKDIGYYAEDAISYYQNRKPLVGKTAIREFLTADLNENSNVISFKTNEVFVSNDGNQVVETGAFTLTDSSKVIINSGNYISLFEKRNGKYVCLRDMSASDLTN
ncbi:nuclear transport factor 2 family protein [Flavobacterium aquidurense]|uniref:YybH family protein n=1 Tax=Flavobacterium aquidurense TaxID=362413 RepID=UPI002864B9C0|nr:nuclear transport factor 2 family protein [Flavobacterium aquidurense]MDR7370182.1 ketosteroid isomerase-like protein [Flavobacterium aquidurense]